MKTPLSAGKTQAHEEWARRWRERVRVDALKPGARFQAIDGVRYTYERRDGALSGVFHVTAADGSHTAFAGCAEVLLLEADP